MTWATNFLSVACILVSKLKFNCIQALCRTVFAKDALNGRTVSTGHKRVLFTGVRDASRVSYATVCTTAKDPQPYCKPPPNHQRPTFTLVDPNSGLIPTVKQVSILACMEPRTFWQERAQCGASHYSDPCAKLSLRNST
jgi:hypothetical protein